MGSQRRCSSNNSTPNLPKQPVLVTRPNEAFLWSPSKLIAFTGRSPFLSLWSVEEQPRHHSIPRWCGIRKPDLYMASDVPNKVLPAAEIAHLTGIEHRVA